MKLFKRNVKEIKIYTITYFDGDERIVETIDSTKFSNFMMGLDCCGCEIVEIVEN